MDILIIESKRVTPYHQHFEEGDWCFDVMARSLSFCRKRLFGKNQLWRHRDPDEFFLTACAEGLALKDDQGVTAEFKQRANAILEEGPLALTEQQIAGYRREITQALDDFVDTKDAAEAWFIAQHTATLTARLLLGYHNQWSGIEFKWVYRKLRAYNHRLAHELLDGLDRYRRTDDRAQLARPVESILNLVGGRLYRDGVGNDPAYPTTRMERLLDHPVLFTRKAFRVLRGGAP